MPSPRRNTTPCSGCSGGRTLSLCGRDEEALGCFNRTLQAEPPPDLQIVCRSEYGLSLKRLRRFDEAVRLYEELLLAAKDEDVPRIVTNLATVRIANGQLREAVQLLNPFVRKQPDFPEAWGNLGIARRALGHHEEAARCFRRAIALAPHNTVYQMLYAELCIDDLGWIEEAAAALDQAFDQGHMSRDWLVRFLVCNFLLGREDVVRALVATAPRDLSADELEDLQREATALAKKVAATSSSEKRAAKDESDSSLTATPEKSLGSEQAEGAAADASSPGPADAADEHHGFRMPFTNYRLYNFEFFSLDFYYPINARDFVAMFQQEYRRVTRDVTASIATCGLRPTLFFFTQCPGCGLLILTNRDHGKTLRCRACGTAHESTPVERADLAALLEQVEDSVERKHGRFVRPVHALLVQALDPAKAPLVEHVCSEAGFTRVSETSPLAAALLGTAHQRQILKPGQPFSIWQREFPAGPRVALEATPREIGELVGILRSACGAVATYSMSFDAADDSNHTPLLLGRLDELEERHRRALRERPDDVDELLPLIEILISRRALDEALSKARAAVGHESANPVTWETLGRVEFHRGQWASAVEAFEKALALDPVRPKVLILLAHCHGQLGHPDKAAAFAARARTLGGNAILGP
jgi:tetratricopeptide (TPR) repeat protein